MFYAFVCHDKLQRKCKNTKCYLNKLYIAQNLYSDNLEKIHDRIYSIGSGTKFTHFYFCKYEVGSIIEG